MKVYIAHYENTEHGADFDHWFGDRVYKDKEDCKAEIISKGYTLDEEGSYSFILVNNGETICCAEIEDFEFIE